MADHLSAEEVHRRYRVVRRIKFQVLIVMGFFTFGLALSGSIHLSRMLALDGLLLVAVVVVLGSIDKAMRPWITGHESGEKCEGHD